jgi:tRNA-dihydrouridine synthase C
VAPTPAHRGLFLALAPMDGVTDWVYRGLLTDLEGGNSGISLCVSEFVRVTGVRVPDHVILRHCPELRTSGRTRAGIPVFVQLLGGQPGPLAETARAAAELGAPGIDLNFGCPAKTVNNHDGGAALLQAPERIERIVAEVRRATSDAIPVSVKIRLGWAHADHVGAIARAAEAGGAAWLTIHARTRLQLYRPPVDWAAIGRAGQAVRIPVVANGDLATPQDVTACARASGCTAFMIGRGAMARPRLFRRLRDPSETDLDLPGLASLWLDYTDRLLVAGAPPRAALGRLKQWLRLAAPTFEDVRPIFDVVKRESTLAGACAIARALLPGRSTARPCPSIA